MYCYVGGKGSGKSYSVVQNVCLPAFKAGIPIYTNLSLNVDLIRKDFIHADVTFLKNMSELDILNTPYGSILIIDEIQLIFGASVTYTKINTELLEFFSKSRHKVDKGRAINVVIISQTLDGISKPIRSLIDSLYKCRKLSIVGAINRYQIKQYEMSADSIISKKPLVVANGKYLKDVYKYYHSNSQNVLSDNDNIVHIQEKLVKEKTIFNNRLIQFTLLSPLIIFLFYYFFLSHLFDFSDTEVNDTKFNDIKVNDIKVNDTKVNTKFNKFLKVNEFYGYPEIKLNGMSIDNVPYFSFNSNVKDIYIDSISLEKLKLMGFKISRVTAELYLVNDFLVSYKPQILSKNTTIFDYLPSTDGK